MQGAGEGYCSHFYGNWASSIDCTRAIDGLEHGPALVDYTVHQHVGGKHDLPFSVEYGMWTLRVNEPLRQDAEPALGSCMIQVEIAGPRFPKTFEFIPNDIVEMAQKIQGVSYIFGF